MQDRESKWTLEFGHFRSSFSSKTSTKSFLHLLKTFFTIPLILAIFLGLIAQPFLGYATASEFCFSHSLAGITCVLWVIVLLHHLAALKLDVMNRNLIFSCRISSDTLELILPSLMASAQIRGSFNWSQLIRLDQAPRFGMHMVRRLIGLFIIEWCHICNLNDFKPFNTHLKIQTHIFPEALWYNQVVLGNH